MYTNTYLSRNIPMLTIHEYFFGELFTRYTIHSQKNQIFTPSNKHFFFRRTYRSGMCLCTFRICLCCCVVWPAQLEISGSTASRAIRHRPSAERCIIVKRWSDMSNSQFPTTNRSKREFHSIASSKQKNGILQRKLKQLINIIIK